jgi:hypothetical protein
VSMPLFVLAVTTSSCRPMAEAAVCNSDKKGSVMPGLSGLTSTPKRGETETAASDLGMCWRRDGRRRERPKRLFQNSAATGTIGWQAIKLTSFFQLG